MLVAVEVPVDVNEELADEVPVALFVVVAELVFVKGFVVPEVVAVVVCVE